VSDPTSDGSPSVPAGIKGSFFSPEDARRSAIIMGLICFIAFFLRLGANGLFDLDEALYANAAREMVLRGDYVSPTVNGAFFFEKPPFVYWCSALCFHLIGINEFAARLPSAIASTLLSFLIFRFGSRHFGLRAGFLAGAFFALSPIVLGAGRQLTTDAMLDLWIAIALISFFSAATSADAKGKRWYYGFWGACAIGVLTKGAPGIILPLAVVLIYVVISEGFQIRAVFSRLWETKPLAGIALFLLISVPWHVAAWRANGDPFYQEYILRQHLQRFRGGDEAHKLPFWFYIPAFLLGFFPWSLFAVPALAERARKRRAEDIGRARLFLKIWCGVVFVVFSVSGSKLVSYILPMYPATALLAGDWCARAASGERRKAVTGGGIFALALTGVMFLAVQFHGPLIRLIEAVSHQPARVNSIPAEMLTLAGHLFGAGVVAMVAFTVLASRRRIDAAFNVLIAGMAAFVLIAVLEGLPAIDRQFSAPVRDAALRAGTLAVPGKLFGVFIGEPRRPSVFFYLPQALVARQSSRSNVLETTDPRKIGDFIRGPRPQIILTDAKRALFVERETNSRIVFTSGQWTVFQVN
jgi:hypothetical protein